MCEESVTVVGSGVDWLTVTGQDDDVGAILSALFSDTLDRTEPLDVKPWQGMGYKGWQAGSVRFGAKQPNLSILMAGGDESERLAENVATTFARPTRFDLQVTIKVTPANVNLAEIVYSEREEANKNVRRERPIRLIKSETGSTFYLGKRTSDIMLRLYDKSLDYGESELGRVWRYEVEFKGRAAESAYDMWFHSKNKVQFVPGLVFAEFSRRGVRPRYSANSEITAIKLSAEVSTADQKISWLYRCVAPVVTQLINTGYEERVIEALSLKHILRKDFK